MADDADRASPSIEDAVEMGIMQARSAPALRPKGKCHFCDECVTGKLLFCDPQCRDDFAEEDDQLKRMGR